MPGKFDTQPPEHALAGKCIGFVGRFPRDIETTGLETHELSDAHYPGRSSEVLGGNRNIAISRIATSASPHSMSDP